MDPTCSSPVIARNLAPTTDPCRVLFTFPDTSSNRGGESFDHNTRELPTEAQRLWKDNARDSAVRKQAWILLTELGVDHLSACESRRASVGGVIG